MADPAQDAAARAALADASRVLGLSLSEFTVLGVRRRRRANSKVPFYDVTLQLATGTQLRYCVSEDGRRAERV
jgi:hypothetical protein